jgi:formate hydrogenlyase transcriptional activator
MIVAGEESLVKRAPRTCREIPLPRIIWSALRETRWVLGGCDGAAARLAMKRTTLQSKRKKLGISRLR